MLEAKVAPGREKEPKKSYRNQLILRARETVPIIAAQLKKTFPTADLEELIGAGNLGLVRAAEKFDRTRGSDTRSFFEVRILWAMLDYIREDSPLSRDVKDLLAQIAREERSSPGTELSIAELARRTGKPEETIQRAIALRDREEISLVSMDQDGEVVHIVDSSPGPEDLARKREMLQQIFLAAPHAGLSERDHQIFREFLKETPGKDIAVLLGIHESRVPQLKNEIFDKLRSFFGFPPLQRKRDRSKKSEGRRNSGEEPKAA